MRVFISLLLAAVACGGESGDYEQFGELEQAYTAASGYGYRTDLSSSQTRCYEQPGGPSGQVCVLPPDKVVRLRVTTDGISDLERAQLEDIAEIVYANWETQLNSAAGWDLGIVTSGNGDINVRYGSLSGGAITSIHRFARMTTINNTSPLNDDGLPGEWRRYTGANVCTIDKAAIDASFSTAIQRSRVRSHALYYCMLKPMGIGSRTTATSKAYTIAVTPNSTKDITLGNRVRCYLNTLDNTVPPNLTLHTGCNSAPDN